MVVVVLCVVLCAEAIGKPARHISRATFGAFDGGKAFAPLLVTAHGRYVYTFSRDTATASHCTGRCAREWRPVLTSGRPRVLRGSGLAGRKLGAITRPNGTLQVTYMHHPLYRWAKHDGRHDYFTNALGSQGGSFFLESVTGPAGCKGCGY